MLRALTIFSLMCAVLNIVTTTPAHSADAPMFRGNEQHTGVYPAGGIAVAPSIKWRFHTAGEVIASPALVGGTLYVGSTDGNLYAIDATTGAMRWKFATKGRIVSSPAVQDSTVYFLSYDSNFYAISSDSGKLKWKFKTLGEHRFEATHLHGFEPAGEIMPDVFDVYLSSPVVWHGRVYFGSSDGNVYALNETSGALDWKFKTNNVVHASPAIDNGVLYIGSWDSYFYALDATTGKQVWRFKTGDDPVIHNQVGVQSSAAVAEGTVFFGCRDSHVYALDAKSGREVWSVATQGSWVVGSPAVRGDMVYFSTSDSSQVRGVYADNGDEVFTLAFHGWPLFSSPAIAGDMLFVGSWAGKLMAIDLKHHNVAWTFVTDGARKNAAFLTKADGTPDYEHAYHSNFYDDMVIGYNTMMTTGAVLSSPVVDGDVIYFGSTDGTLYALATSE